MIRFDEITKLSLMNFFLNLYFLSPVAVFFFQYRGLDFFQILALESFLVLFIFLFEIPTGIFADKFGRKCAIVLGAILLASEPVLFLFATNYALFVLAFALSGIGLAFLSGAVEAHIYGSLGHNKPHLMKKAMGRYGSAALFAMVVAPIVGSVLAKDLLPHQFLLLVYLTAGAALLGVITSLFLRKNHEKLPNKENSFALLLDGIRLLRHNRNLLRIVLLSMVSSPFLYSLTYLAQPYFKASGVNVAVFGVVFAVALLVSALFQRYSYKFEELLGMKQGVFIATLAPGVLYLVMAFVFQPAFSITLFILLRAFAGLREPLFSAYKNIHIPNQNRATVLSLISMLVSLYLVVLRLGIGRLADINLSYAFVLMGSIIVLGSIALRINEIHVTRP